MNKEEIIGKLQMVYVGDRNALNELIGYYDGLKQGIEELQQENKQLKHNWNYIKKMLKEARQEKYISGYCGTCTDVDIDFLLDKMQEMMGGDK